jgi:hypothetical protein
MFILRCCSTSGTPLIAFHPAATHAELLMPMKRFALTLGLLTCGFVRLALGQQTETIVLIRHGEKPAEEIGQINTQGLNRALALPDVLVAKFKAPNFIFAPGTTDKTDKKGAEYSYLRPLITIEPTAIKLGLPVNTDFGYRHTDDLEAELLKDKYEGAVIYVAWEHHALDAMVKKMVADLGGTGITVPEWPRDDFDSIFVLTIHTGADHQKTVEFHVDHENLKPAMTYPAPSKE